MFYCVSRVLNMEATISRSIAKFALQFCNELGTSKTSVCSPLSAESVLALLALGCRGQTRAELLQALDLPDDDGIRSLFKSLTPKVQNLYGATLNTANKVYVKEGGTLKPELKKDAEEVFRAELEQLDFKNSAAAANVINKWALWKEKFKTSNTRKRKFHVDNATTVEIPMMSMEDYTMMYGSSSKLKAKFLEMPYKGVQSSMVFVLPDDVEGLNSVLQKLAAGHDLMADIEAMKYEALDITIPTFKAETTIDLKDLLQKMGIKSIFNEATSEIDMLTSSERLYVSHAVQKAYIMVNESGTEASAATGCYFRNCSLKMKRPQIPFTADRPFLFLLMACRVPVFVGMYRGGQETIPSAADLPTDEQESDFDL